MKKKPFVALFLVVVTELIGFGLIIPVLPQIALNFNTSPFFIGFLMSAYSLAQFIASPFLGFLSDKYGRRPVLVFSKFGSAFSYIIMALSHTYWVFFLARVIDGFTGGNISVARAYVTDITTPEERPKGMAIIGIAFGTGFILGPALGGFLYASNSFMVPAIVAGTLSFIAALLTVFILPEPKKRHKSTAAAETLFTQFKILKSAPVLIILVGYLLYMCVFSGFETTFSVFTHTLFNFNVSDNSWLFVYIGLLSLIIQGSIARRSFKKLKAVTTTAFLVFALGIFLLAQSFSVISLLYSIAIMALGLGTLNSFLPSLMSIYSPPHLQGMVMGFYESIGSLSRILGPLIAYSWIIKEPRQGYMLYALALVLTGSLLYLALKKDTHPT